MLDLHIADEVTLELPSTQPAAPTMTELLQNGNICLLQTLQMLKQKE
jgi:hypothetical protein